MKLIDRYVLAVAEHLPEDMREDVSKELRTNIEDMLPEDSTEEDVYQILEKLGNPGKLANDYYPKKRYLIGPGLYDKYFSVLKMVLGIFTIVLVCITLLEWILDPPVDGYLPGMIAKLFVDLIHAVVEGVMQSALWVTLVFVVLERSGVNEGEIPFLYKKWTPDDLPTLPVNHKRNISRGETVFSMFCTVLFTSVLYFQPRLIALYIKGDSGITTIPLFEIERLQIYMLFIFLLAIIQLAIFIWKFITKSWSIPLAITNAIHNVLLCIFVIIMVSDHSLINNDFLTKISEYSKMSVDKIELIRDGNVWIFSAVFVAICIFDSISSFMKCKK